MLQKNIRPVLLLSLLTIMVALAAGSPAHASDPRKVWGNLREPCTHCHDCLSKDVYFSEFFGYYRTCWRRWPGGQPPCPPSAPPAEVVSEVKSPEAAAKDHSLQELLPTPKPDAGKK